MSDDFNDMSLTPDSSTRTRLPVVIARHLPRKNTASYVGLHVQDPMNPLFGVLQRREGESRRSLMVRRATTPETDEGIVFGEPEPPSDPDAWMTARVQGPLPGPSRFVS